MRAIYLIARREYLAFVMAWGFWVSLLIVPFILFVAFSAPLLAERAAPIRYYAVVTDDPSLETAFQAGLTRGGRDAYVGAIRAAARIRGAGPEAERRALDVFNEAGDAQAGLAAAAGELGLPSVAAFQLPQFRMERVPAPADTADGLRPYLLGDATVETPEGPRSLHAAVFLRRDAQGGVEVDYWSAALTDRTLLNVAERAMRDLLRQEALNAAGVPAEAVTRANSAAPRLTEFNPARATEDARVTFADRLPFIMGVVMGLVLWTVVFSVVNVLLTSVIEEKGAKILEALLATARYHEILIGKLLGVAAVSATLIAVWGLFGAFSLFSAAQAGAAIPSQALDALLDPSLLIPFVAYFVLGYLLFGSIFLAVGSLCETIQEAQTLMTPMIFVLMVPMFMVPVMFRSPDSPLLAALSWIPLYTPFLMMIRLPTDPPLWEVVGTSLVLVAFTMLILWGAGGVFRAGVIGRAGPDSLKRFFGRMLRGGKPEGGALPEKANP